MSLDYWHARVALPRGANPSDQPARGTAVSPLRDKIWARLLDSLGTGGVLNRTLEWSLILNQLPAWAGGGVAGLLNRTRAEWDRVRSHIDAGQPWPIGLIYTGRDVWFQHQILVYGYEVTGANTGKLYVYDSNAPSQYRERFTKCEITLDFSGPSLVATSPSDGPGSMLAGFFCSNYAPSAATPDLAKNFGQFLTWIGDPRTWMVVEGARMPLAGNTELTALGGTPADVRATNLDFENKTTRPRDGALLRERSDARVYLYQGGSPFWVPDPNWLTRFGGWGATRIVPDNTLAAFVGPPDEGTLLREWSDAKVYRIMAGTRRWVTTPGELERYGGFPSVRVVPDGALAAIPIGQVLPGPAPGECAALRRQISTLTKRIADLNKELDTIEDPRLERVLQNRLATATRELNTAKARATILQCP